MNHEKIILFDGVCNLCNSSVNFIIDRDKKNIFKFAALQSETGQKLLGHSKMNQKDFDSVVLIENGKIYSKSTAALKIIKEFSSLWKILYAFIIIPQPVRNYIYDVVASNRYKWFGKKDSCRIPTPDLKEKFLI